MIKEMCSRRARGGAHIRAKAELGVCRGAANWAKNGTPYILVFTAILSLMEQVKTSNGRFLPNEAFFKQFY
jgi:hypothetical protein